MSRFKAKIVVALALATALSGPALAGMNGTESINRMQSAQRVWAYSPEAQARAELLMTQPTAVVASKPFPHRYYGGQRSFH
jgi:hypothetical protein